MKKKEVILQKDDRQISFDIDDCKDELNRMQSHVDYFNGLHYTEDLTTIDEVKSYLTNPVEYHEQQVIIFLQSKVNGELPPNLQPLRESWNITEVSEFDFSENEYFEHLEIKDGILSYSDSVYNEIEKKHTLVATPEQAKALNELTRFFSNAEKIVDVMYPMGGAYKQRAMKSIEIIFTPVFAKKSFGEVEDGVLIEFNPKRIEELANAGFGKKIV